MWQTSKQELEAGWQLIKVKGKGGGVDQVSLRDFGLRLDQNLEQLLTDLNERHYTPDPPLTISIPKPGSGDYRKISLLTVRDKLAQLVVKRQIEPVLEPLFSPFSYAYRPGKGHQLMIRAISGMIQCGHGFIWQADIDNYFDSINHTVLRKQIAPVIQDDWMLNLLELWTRMGSIRCGVWFDRTVGIPQGGVLSPLLSNWYLTGFDQAVITDRKGFHYVRYADNFLFLGRTADCVSSHIPAAIAYLADPLKLKLNDTRPEPQPVNQPFSFCGIQFSIMDGTAAVQRSIAPGKMERADQTIHQYRHFLKEDPKAWLHHINELVAGWHHYYGPWETAGQLKILEGKVLEEIRYQAIPALSEKGKSKTEINDLLKRMLPDLKTISLLRWPPAPVILNRGQKMSPGQPTVTARLATSANSDAPHPFSPAEDQSTPSAKPAGETVKRKIERKKRYYNRLLSFRFDLLADEPGSILGRSGSNAVLRAGNKIIKSKPLSTLRSVAISARKCSISSDLLLDCAKEGIRIELLSSDGTPMGFLTSPEYVGWEVSRFQEQATRNIKGFTIAQSLVLSKIINQEAVIRYFMKQRVPENPAPDWIAEELTRMAEYRKRITELSFTGDFSSRSASLMGYEGLAASSWWRVFRYLLPDTIPFEGRVRRGATDLVNASLNYGYGILYNRMLSAVVHAGLNPLISYLHSDQEIKPTLVFDLVEIFRQPLVDRAILKAFRLHKLHHSGNTFSPPVKQAIARLVLDRLYAPFYHHGKETCLDVIFYETATELAEYLTGKRAHFSPWHFKW
ncbi:MAG: CRISPR-associated endonuclease Cas1 [Bacteroidetes bacterium]|nr:CRISPR-associated endonuclease Cas1 [Bacteroidota bacterium]